MSGFVFLLIANFVDPIERAIIITFGRTFNMPTSIVGVGKRGSYQLVHGDAKEAPVTGTTLRFTGPVSVDSRQ